jgi:hypothetical protein
MGCRANYEAIRRGFKEMELTRKEVACQLGCALSTLQKVTSKAHFDNGKGHSSSLLSRVEKVLHMQPGGAFFREARVSKRPRRAKASMSAQSSIRLCASLRLAIDNQDATSDVKNSIDAVLHHHHYPRVMSRTGELVSNPVWAGISTRTIRDFTQNNPLDGPGAPTVRDCDLFLIRCNDGQGHGMLYTYLNPDWRIYMFPFRERTLHEEANRRVTYDADHLARLLRLLPETVEITLLPEYVVSVKPKGRNDDLVLYIFHFCAVKLSLDANLSPDSLIRNFRNVRKSRWFYLQQLDRSKTAMKANGDVISSIKQSFQITLSGLPLSISKQLADAQE